ncbi:organomercurial lyase MerB [Alicyclobacillus sendaiensis]|uniref:organomercurial lyase MerB n=1 Tax=Alicyclobacillus sendaiensis TaxID=192387 RepID=UPI00350E56AF
MKVETKFQNIAYRLAKSFDQPGETRSLKWIMRPLLQLITRGMPVSVEDIASETGKSVDEIRDTLSALPSVELDEQGRVIGCGLTLVPTPHRFWVEEKQLYTWCALDTLMFPQLIGRTAYIESPCHSSGTPVRLTVEPERIVSVVPSWAVVSIVTPDDMSSVRSAFCNEVHYFSSASKAQKWLDQHPGASVVSVEDAFELGRLLGRQFENGFDMQSCCDV